MYFTSASCVVTIASLSECLYIIITSKCVHRTQIIPSLAVHNQNGFNACTSFEPEPALTASLFMRLATLVTLELPLYVTLAPKQTDISIQLVET